MSRPLPTRHSECLDYLVGGVMGGGCGGKRALKSLVGKFEPNVKLKVELEANQVNSITPKLYELEEADPMAGD